MCTPYIHKTNETSSGISEGEKNQIDHISERHIDSLQFWDTLVNQMEFIKDLFQMLGLIINKKIPVSTIPEYHIFGPGSINNNIILQVTLPKGKFLWTQQEAKHLYAKTEVSVQKMAAFVGMTTAAK